MLLNNILFIQSFVRGKKTRIKLNNIYKLLPYDLQQKIIVFINKDECSIINKIIYKKVINICCRTEYLYTLIDYTSYKMYNNLNTFFGNSITIFMNKLNNIYYLINKYYNVLNLNKYEYTLLYKLSINYNCQDYNPNLYNEIKMFKNKYNKTNKIIN